MKQIPLIILLTLYWITSFGQANPIVTSSEYRVVAYKTGYPSIYSESNIAEADVALHLYIPNSFTPNGDGMNDIFLVKGEGMQTFSMKIYDRWGNMIYESNNIHQGWNGIIDQEPAQEDVYVYQVQVESTTNETQKQTGSITLIR